MKKIHMLFAVAILFSCSKNTEQESFKKSSVGKEFDAYSIGINISNSYEYATKTNKVMQKSSDSSMTSLTPEVIEKNDLISV